MATTVFDVLLSISRRLGRYNDGVAVSCTASWMSDTVNFNETPGYWDGGTILIETTPSGATTTNVKQSTKIVTFASPGMFYFTRPTPVPSIGAVFTVTHRRVPRTAMLEAINTALRAARQARANRKVE